MAAGLAGHAEFQRVHHLVGGQRIRPELAGDRQPQRIGAAARDILLVAGGAIGRAHHAAFELAAGAVVVAHLDRALEAAAGAGIGRPVERGLQLADAIVRRIAKQRAVIHFWRIDDLAGIEHALPGSKRCLTSLKSAMMRAPNIASWNSERTDAVAVLAGMRALVLAHHREGFLGDGAHRLDVLLELQVEHRAHMQAAFGGVRIHGAAGAVFGEDGVEPLGVVGEMRQRHRAILDERDRLALLLHRHHDVEAGGAETRRSRSAAQASMISTTPPHLRCGWSQPKPRSAISSPSCFSRAEFSAWSSSANSTISDRIGIAAHGSVDDRLEHRDLAAERDHGAIDQLDRDRAAASPDAGRHPSPRRNCRNGRRRAPCCGSPATASARPGW